jgi:hypothetical protein
MITIKFEESKIKNASLQRLLDALYPIEDELNYKGSVSTAINELQDILDFRRRNMHTSPTINGIKVRNFHYVEGSEQLIAYDYNDRVIASFLMSPSQWLKISSGSYAKCWNELVELFADPVEEV